MNFHTFQLPSFSQFFLGLEPRETSPTPTGQERLDRLDASWAHVLREVAALRMDSSLDTSPMSDDKRAAMSPEVIQFRLENIERTMAEMAKDVRSLRETSLVHQNLPSDAQELRSRVEVLEKLVVKAEGATWIVRILWALGGTAVIAGLIKWWHFVGGPKG